MKGLFSLATTIPNITAEIGRLSRRRRVVLWCVVAWTVFTGLALWWLFRANAGPSVWVVQEGDSLQPAAVERFHAVFKADIGLQRVYPWVLLGPYVALLASCFPLERGRLRLSLPLNVAAGVAFVAASHAINARTSSTGANLVIVQSQPPADPSSGSPEASTNQADVSPFSLGDLLQKRMTNDPARRPPVHRPLHGTVVRRQSDFSDAGLTNLRAQLHPDFKPPLFPPRLTRWSLWATLLDLLAYGALVGLAHSVHFYRRFRERERRTLVLESNLTHARLHALRAQLQPHFLFNSLNAIVTLLRRDPRQAEATLMSLSELLRLALSQSERQEVALGEELQFVQRYLEIQQTRFSDKLRVEQQIEPPTLDCLVPTLLLQPLVENALRHGLEPAEHAGLVRLTARRQDRRLVLTVEDDGVGLPEATGDPPQPITPGITVNADSLSAASSAALPGAEGVRGGTGIGLANLRARLETHYGADQKLELVPRAGRGVTVVIQIPWRSVRPLETRGTGDPR